MRTLDAVEAAGSGCKSVGNSTVLEFEGDASGAGSLAVDASEAAGMALLASSARANNN